MQPSPTHAPAPAQEKQEKESRGLFGKKKKKKKSPTSEDLPATTQPESDHSNSSQPPPPSTVQANDNGEWKLFDSPRKKVSIDDFDLVAELGKGSFGEVFKVNYTKRRRKAAQDSSAPPSPVADDGKDKDKFYALKIMSKAKICKPQEVLSERAVLQHIDHPFVVRLVGAFQTPTKLCLILSYLPFGNLREHLKQCVALSPQCAAFTSACILLALEYLHENKIIYRDLKPENIVMDELGYPVLTDMGLAKELKEQMAHTCCGTPLYTAPEVLTSRDAGGYTTAVDWWSFGIILAEMLQGVPPFYSNNSKAVFQLVLNKPPQLAPPVVDIGKQIITEFLAKNPRQRLTDPVAIKQKEFFAVFGFNWQSLRGRKVCPLFCSFLHFEFYLWNLRRISACVWRGFYTFNFSFGMGIHVRHIHLLTFVFCCWSLCGI